MISSTVGNLKMLGEKKIGVQSHSRMMGLSKHPQFSAKTPTRYALD